MILDIENPVEKPIRSYIGDDLVWQDFVFTPVDLFANGEQGVWFDSSDLSTMFQDVAGTVPVTKDGDPVGLIRDKSGNGNHATQPTASARPIYRTDGKLHWLEFDGVDDQFDIPNMDFVGGNIVISASIRPMETSRTNKTLLSQYGSRKSLVWYFASTAQRLHTPTGSTNQLTSIPNDEDVVLGARNTQVDNFKGSRINGVEFTNNQPFDAATSNEPAMAMLGSADGYYQRFGGRLYGIAAVFDDSAVEIMEDIDLYMASKAGVTL